MTRPYNALGDLHLPARESDYYQDRRAPGWSQLLCACFILLTIAALFKASDLMSANRTAPVAHASQLTQLADDIDRWERSETRQLTTTVPNSDEFVLVTSVDQ